MKYKAKRIKDNKEIVGKNEALNIADVVRSFLKENLIIKMETDKETGYSQECTSITATIMLGDEKLCESSDNLYH